MRFLVLALLAGACNQVFGIEDTVPPPLSDFDHDGVDDSHDICPTIANAAQVDADHDGFGDACDPCPLGPQSGSDGDMDGIDDACDACLTGLNHEEDGDGALDGCDVCPGIADDQADADGDGLGDACDPDAAAIPIAQHRIFFDSFDPPLDGWQFGFESWVAVGGDLVSQARPMQAYRGPWNPRAMVDGTEWVISTQIDVPPSPQVGDIVGVFAYQPDGSATLGCGISRGDGFWVPFGGSAPVTLGPTIVVTEYAHADAGGIGVYCSIDDMPAVLIAALSTQPWYPAITGVPGARFHWLDVAR